MQYDESGPCLLFQLPPELFLICCTAFTPKNLFLRRPRYKNRYLVDRVVDFKEIRFLRSDEEGEIDIPHNVIYSYLTFPDWIALDSAITNRKLRKEYLYMIENATIAFPDILSLQHTYDFTEMLNWMKIRKLRLNSLYFNSSTIQQLQLTTCDLSQVNKLRCETPNKDQSLFAWNFIAKEMPNLTLLDCTNNLKLTSSAIKLIVKHCPSIKSLSLSACKYIKDNSLNKIVVFASNLQYLDVSKCDISYSCLVGFIKKLPNLVSLNVTSCHFSYKQIAGLLQERPNLEELLANYPEFTYTNQSKECLDVDVLSETINRHGSNLYSLSLKNCRVMQDHHLRQIISSCRKLKKLSLEGCFLLTDTMISQIGMNCEDMRALDLRNCGSLTDEGIEMLSPFLRQCRDLAIDGCYKLTNRSINAFLNIPKRTKVHSGHGLQISFTHCPKITDFDSSVITLYI